MIRPTLAPTVAALSRAIASTGLTPEQVDVVLLAGGSSRIPLVGQLIAAELGRPVAVDVHPKHAVALGAARHIVGNDTAPVEAPAPPPPPSAPPVETTPPPPPPAAEPERAAEPAPEAPPTQAGQPRRRMRAVGLAAAVVVALAGIAFAVTRGGDDGGSGSTGDTLQPTATLSPTATRAAAAASAIAAINRIAESELRFLTTQRRWSASQDELGLGSSGIQESETPVSNVGAVAVQVDGFTLHLAATATDGACFYERLQAIQPTKIDYAIHRPAAGVTCPPLKTASYATNGWEEIGLKG